MNLGFQLPKPKLDARLMGAHRLSVLTDEALFAACGTRIAFTGREGGVSKAPYESLNLGGHVGDSATAVAENRARVLQALGAPDAPLVVPNQVHKADVVRISGTAVSFIRSGRDAACAGGDAAVRVGGEGAATEAAFAAAAPVGSASEPASSYACGCADATSPKALASVASAANAAAAEGADALCVRTPGVAALLNFADCTPVIIVSPSGNFAIAHAGWRGAVAGVAGNAARALIEADLADGALAARMPAFRGATVRQVASACNAYIGPHIQVECFETGEDVAQAFRDAYPEAAAEVVPDSRHVDLTQAVRADLLRAGFASARICDAGICTKCHPEKYFSYRAEDGKCGRHGALAICF